MRGLYAICDLDALSERGLDPLQYAATIVAIGPTALQLRAKRLSPRNTVELLRAIKPLCAATATPLFANDRPDLASIAGCDGVHVGQHDVSVSVARRTAPRLRIGVSTHSITQLEAALAERPDYVAFGPVFSTTSKENPDSTVGIEGLKAASRLARQHAIPLVAIGGIQHRHLPELVPWVDAVAIISGLLPTRGSNDLSEVVERARAIQVAFG